MKRGALKMDVKFIRTWSESLMLLCIFGPALSLVRAGRSRKAPVVLAPGYPSDARELHKVLDK